MAYDAGSTAVLCLLAVALIAGMAGNVFIVVQNLMKWRKKQVLNSCDFMVSCIAISNIQILILSVGTCFSAVTVPEFYGNKKLLNVLTVLCFLILSSGLWFSAWLCADYCLRIVNSNSKLFSALKTRFPKLGPLLVCVTIVGSLLINLPGFFDLHIIVQTNITNDVISPVQMESRCNCFFYVFFPFISMAFVICLSSVLAILTSLLKHIRRMEQNTSSKGNRRLAAHFGAAKTVTFLLLLYFLLYASQFIIFFQTALINQQAFWVCSFLVMYFPTMNSVVLIQGNPRLWTSFFKLLQNIRCLRTNLSNHALHLISFIRTTHKDL